MKLRILLLVSLALFGAACSETSSDSQTATDAATEEMALDDIPSLSGLTLPTATPIPIPVSIDDERFPIQPDAAGQALYEANCAECHGINGGGQNPADPYALNEDGLMIAPPHTNAGHTWHHPDQQNFAAVWAGRQVPGSLPMPGFGERLTVDEVMKILAYIKTWWGADELSVQAEQTITAAGR